jgi:hypothetical protein
VDKVSAVLRRWQESASRSARSGRPLRATFEGYSLELADLPIRAESDPAFVRGVLQAAADAIAGAEVTSFGQIARRRCPACNDFLAKLSVWADPRDSRDREEREWTCGLGHKTVHLPGALGPATAAPPSPLDAGDVDAAEAFARIGPWQGESASEIATALVDARRRGGTRRVPAL